MKAYPVGVAVTVTIPYLDFNGDPVAPTGVTVRILDQDGVVLYTDTSVAVASADSDLTYTVSSAYNLLKADESAGARTVEADIQTAAGIFPASVSYLVRANKRLVPVSNSFQTYEQALVAASQLPSVAAWEAADPEDRKNALEEAYRRLTAIGYRIRANEVQEDVIDDQDHIVRPTRWPSMTISDWNKLPAKFHAALRRAQVVEAADILTNDPAEYKRRLGVLSESIGESSMMFRSGKPLDLGISAAALSQLTGYIEFRITTTRA